MLLWFASLFCIGLWRISSEKTILRALNPVEAIRYLIREKRNGFTQIGQLNDVPIDSFSCLCLGGVFLSVTGCEALFADLGQIGVSLSLLRRSTVCVQRTLRPLACQTQLVPGGFPVCGEQLFGSRCFSHRSS